MRTQSSKGFSLIEVMVAVAMLGIISIGFAKLMVGANSSNVNINQQNAANDMARAISTLLTDEGTCEANFQINGVTGVATTTGRTTKGGTATAALPTTPELGNGLGTAGPPITLDLISKTGAIVYPVGAGTNVQNNLIRIDSYSVDGWVNNDVTTTHNIVEGVAQLTINMSKISASTGSQSFTRKIALTVYKNTVSGAGNDTPVDTVYTCFATGPTDTFWVAGSVANSIDYGLGNVGIGLSNPNSALDVIGNISATGVIGNFPLTATVGAPIPAATNGLVIGTDGTVQLKANRGGSATTTILNLLSPGEGPGQSTTVLFGSGGLTPSGSIPTIQSEAAFGEIYDGPAGTSSHSLTFSTTNGLNNLTEKMRVSYTGNVGIGTTTPAQILDIKADGSSFAGSRTRVNITNATANASQSSAVSMNNGGLVSWELGTDLQQNGTNSFYFANNKTLPSSTVTIPLYISASDNVGIGTTTPNAALDVRANATSVAEINIGTFANGGLVAFGNDSGAQPGGNMVSFNSSEFGIYTTQGRGMNFYTGGSASPRLNIANSSGNVGIGTITPAFPLDVNGAVSAQAFLVSSDARLKNYDDDTKLDGIAIVNQLNGYHFTWKDTGKADVGVIAQEVQKVLPELVHVKPNGSLTVDYSRLVAPLIEAVKWLATEFSSLRNLVDAHSQELESQQAQLDELSKEFQDVKANCYKNKQSRETH